MVLFRLVEGVGEPKLFRRPIIVVFQKQPTKEGV